jgi:cytochrome c oxidase cbb3-type subunit 2
MRALRRTGVPYSLTQEEYEANVETFGQEMADKLDIHRAQESLLAEAREHNYDGVPERLTEMDAMVAYLQMLGTLVDFSKYEEGYFAEFR